MSNSFNDLKRSSRDNLQKLITELNKTQNNQVNSGVDERMWKPEVDKAGNGQAIIRFLPAPQGEDMPYIRFWDHGFQGPGGWYIEKSLTTLGQPDPLSELNTRLWNSGVDVDREQARKQKRRLHYVANIYVVRDSANPDNEGKVFLFTFGKKIFDKINDIMNPSFEDEKPVNPFDLWDGANFKLRIRNVEGYRNYDKSEFDSPSPLHNDDDELESIWKQEYSLQAFLDPKNYKTYDELKSRLDRALGLTEQAQPKTQRAVDNTPPWDDDQEFVSQASKGVADDDDDLGYFTKLARE